MAIPKEEVQLPPDLVQCLEKPKHLSYLSRLKQWYWNLLRVERYCDVLNVSVKSFVIYYLVSA